MVGKVRLLSVATAAAGLLLATGCADESPALPKRDEMTVGGEVFHILCKRVAAAAYPDELTGFRFNAPCDGQAGVDEGEDLRFASMVEHRAEIVAALDQVFGDSETPPAQGAGFADGELDDFLANLIPFYDKPEEWTPRATRAIGKIMEELVSGEKIPEEVLKALARVAPRVGYRPLEHVLGALRPALTYPGLDELTRQFMTLVTEGGRAHPTLVDLLKAGALELAQEKDPGRACTPQRARCARRSTCCSSEDDAFAPEGDAPVWVVKRDERGRALPAAVDRAVRRRWYAATRQSGPTATSSRRSPASDSQPVRACSQRTRGSAMPSGARCAVRRRTPRRCIRTSTPTAPALAALMREPYDLVVRDGDRSTVEKPVARSAPAARAQQASHGDSSVPRRRLRSKGQRSTRARCSTSCTRSRRCCATRRPTACSRCSRA